MSKTPHISMPDSSERDWTEDFQHENGNYSCKCCECGLYFYGHKRRPICKVCANKEPDWNTISKKQPPEDKKGNIAWHGAWLEGEMVGYARCMVKKVNVLKQELASLQSSHRELYEALKETGKLYQPELMRYFPVHYNKILESLANAEKLLKP